MMHSINRRNFLIGSSYSLLAPFAQPASTDFSVVGWPTKAVRLIVGYPAGGSVDNSARLLASALTEKFSQPFIVENRVGADGAIAASSVIRSAPDGYTLLVSLKGAMTVAPSISKLPYEPLRDLLPIASIAQTPEIFVARPRVGITSLGEFSDAIIRNGRRLTIGYIGAYPRLLAELLTLQVPGALLTVPYKGLPQAMQDLLGDQIDMLVGDATGLVIEQVRAGKVVPLAVTSDQRHKRLPNTPTVKEIGLQALSGMQWYALFGPVGMSRHLTSEISDVVNIALNSNQAKAQLESYGLERMVASQDDLKKLMLLETKFWKSVAKKVNISPN
jgi:tripartite-type tricarboxylate transporter receptor subunit TctC